MVKKTHIIMTYVSENNRFCFLYLQVHVKMKRVKIYVNCQLLTAGFLLCALRVKNISQLF